MKMQTRQWANTEVRLAQRAVEAADANERSPVEGYAAVFNSDSVDFGGGFFEQIAPGAFRRSLADAAAGNALIHAFWQHDSDEVLGSTGARNLTLEEDDKGLRFTLTPERMNDMQYLAIRDGDLQVSFGMYIRAYTFQERDDETVVRIITDVDLVEISPVTYPAYPATSVGTQRGAVTRAVQTRDDILEDIKADYEVWKAERSAAAAAEQIKGERRNAIIANLNNRAKLLRAM